MNEEAMFQYSPSNEQIRQLDSLLAILAECRRFGIRVWVVGGYGLDALYGALTRDHSDFDLFIREESEEKFIQIARKYGYKPTSRKVGEVGKSIFVNPALSPSFRLELGTIEQAEKLLRKLNISVDISLFTPEKPLGRLRDQSIWTPTLEGLKKMIEINDKLAKKAGGDEYPYRDWQKKILMVLEGQAQ